MYLRHRIYGYLLDGKRTKIQRVSPSRISYKFHTNILGVNHRIHDEAQEYLYKHNEFILVSNDPTRHSSTLMPPWIPLVAELGTRSMRYHCLEITLLLCHGVMYPKPSVRVRLLLAQDVEKYCLAINLHLSRSMYCLKPQTPMLSLHQNRSLFDCYSDGAGGHLRPHYLCLDFGNNRFHNTTAEFQSALISRFRSMYSSSLHVEIRGHVIQTSELTTFRMAAKPGLMCTSSRAWRAFWDLDSLKELADSLTHDNELELACIVYLQTWNTIASVNPTQLPLDVRRPFQYLLLDTTLTLA